MFCIARVVALSVLLLGGALPASAAIAHVQDSVYLPASGSPLTSVLTFGSNITAGNAVFCLITHSGTGGRTFTVDGSIEDSANWVQLHDSGSNASNEIWVIADHDGGAETITVTHGQSTSAFGAVCAEFSGFGGVVNKEVATGFTDPEPTDNHFSADETGLSASGELLGLSMGYLNGSVTSTAPGSDWTVIPLSSPPTQRLAGQYRIFPSGVSGERGPWTSNGTDRIAESALVLVSGSGEGGGEDPLRRGSMLLTGVGR